jgi:hypothetical protein
VVTNDNWDSHRHSARHDYRRVVCAHVVLYVGNGRMFPRAQLMPSDGVLLSVL